MKKLIILDGNALLHRAFHAIRPLTDPKGRPVNALYGFSKVLTKIIADSKPEYIAVCWDRREKTFRHEAYKNYKATRKAQPQDLYDQVDMIKEMLNLYNIPSYDKVGYEADDLLGTIANKMKSKVDKVLILTGDMDALQLVEDKVNIIAFKKGVSDVIRYDEAEVKRKYGLEPKQIIDLKALMGDASDNIKGVKGIGAKGAEALIKKFGSVENLYKKLEDSDIKETQKKLLLADKENAFKSLDLVEIRKNVPGSYSLSDMKFGDYDKDKLNDFFVEYGFRTLTTNNDFKKVEPNNTHLIKATDVKEFIKNIKEKDELIFYIQEAEEGLFGKDVKNFSCLSGKIHFDFYPNKNLSIKDVMQLMKPIFENKNIKKISHDFKEQMHILSNFNINLEGLYFDTMLAGYIINPGKRHYEIDEMILEYLKKKKDKGVIVDILNLKDEFTKKIKEEKLEKIFFDIEMPLIPILFNMERNGIKLDIDLLKKMSNDFSKRLKEIDKKIYKLADEEFNIDSPSQLQVILYEKMKLEPESGRIKRGKTGLSTAASELEKLIGTSDIIELIMEHRELAKLMNTYIEALPRLVTKDGRVHSTFNQTVTTTGRLSSSNPNMQNIPIRSEMGRKIRQAFVADRGNVLVSLDYSQFELRLASVIAGEGHMIEAFNKGIDIHAKIASEVFDIPLDKVTKEDRYKAKAVNFGVLYGMGALGLARATKMSRNEAENFLEKYYAKHPKIVEYMEVTKALAHKRGYVETLFGRRRYLPELKSYMPQLRATGERMAINMPIQGTQADLIKMAMINVYNKVCNNNVRMLLQVHDELVFEMPEQGSDEIIEKIKDLMENVYKLKVPLEVHISVDKRWR